jgi:hypothetical protein
MERDGHKQLINAATSRSLKTRCITNSNVREVDMTDDEIMSVILTIYDLKVNKSSIGTAHVPKASSLVVEYNVSDQHEELSEFLSGIDWN